MNAPAWPTIDVDIDTATPAIDPDATIPLAFIPQQGWTPSELDTSLILHTSADTEMVEILEEEETGWPEGSRGPNRIVPEALGVNDTPEIPRSLVAKTTLRLLTITFVTLPLLIIGGILLAVGAACTISIVLIPIGALFLSAGTGCGILGLRLAGVDLHKNKNKA